MNEKNIIRNSESNDISQRMVQNNHADDQRYGISEIIKPE